MTMNLSDFLSQLIHRRGAIRRMAAAGLGFLLNPDLHLFGKNQPRRRVLFFTKSSGYEHDSIKRKGNELGPAERVLTELGTAHGFDVTATKDGSVFTRENLKGYDAIFFYTTGDLTQPGTDKNPPMSKEGKEAFLDLNHSGKGFVGTHSSSDTFHSPGEPFQAQAPEQRDPYIQMLGGEFISHGPQQEASLRLVSPRFPGCEKIEGGFRIKDEWYSLKNFASDLHVILTQTTTGMEGNDYQRPDYPATWARRHGKGRVFYTSMGHREDVWTNPTFQAVLLGGIAWAVGNVRAETPPNLKEAAPEAAAMPPKPPKK
jgi:type 1 glutamine amidotransferase